MCQGRAAFISETFIKATTRDMLDVKYIWGSINGYILYYVAFIIFHVWRKYYCEVIPHADKINHLSVLGISTRCSKQMSHNEAIAKLR